MAIKDFLKKIFSKQEEVKEKEKIKFSQVGRWIEKSSSELGKREEQASENIVSRVNQFISDLETQMKILEIIDTNKKKVEEKVKMIVKENLLLYISYLAKMAESLKEINKKNPLDHLDIIFAEFSKKSEPAYQKATFLIGKELGETRKLISVFSKDINEIVNLNKEVYTKLTLIKKVKKKIEEIDSLKKSESEIILNQEQIGLNLEDKRKAINIIKTSISSLKNSQAYLSSQDKKNENIQAKQELLKEFQKIKEKIDFKHLASIFHVNEKKMRIVKEHNSGFLISLERDNGESILSLLEETRNKELRESLEGLIKKNKELNSFQEIDESLELESDIKRIELEIQSLEQEKTKLEKAKEKLQENTRNLVKEIKSELETINLEITEDS